MKKLHFEGFGRNINICDLLSDNYDHDLRFCFDEASTSSIDNISLRIYESDKKCSAKEAENGFLNKMFGELEAEGQEYGYSEYTIEGFNVLSATLGGHNIQDIINNKHDKYLHIFIEQIKDSK